MKLEPILKFPAPPPNACACCRAFAAECLLPIGDGAIAACWLCAHAVAEHGCAPGDAMTHECECPPENVYPLDSAAYAASWLGRHPGVSAPDAEPTQGMEPDADCVNGIMLSGDAVELVLAKPRSDAPAARGAPRVARGRLR